MAMKKILVVDDEPHVAIVLKQFMERSGYLVISALNGKEALSVIAQEAPDVIITDIQMPVMGGMEFCEWLRSSMPELSRLIIVMTSRTDRDIRTWAERFDNIELMEKPLSLRRLLLRLNEYFAEQND